MMKHCESRATQEYWDSLLKIESGEGIDLNSLNRTKLSPLLKYGDREVKEEIVKNFESMIFRKSVQRTTEAPIPTDDGPSSRIQDKSRTCYEEDEILLLKFGLLYIQQSSMSNDFLIQQFSNLLYTILDKQAQKASCGLMFERYQSLTISSEPKITISSYKNLSSLLYNNRAKCYRKLNNLQLALLDYNSAIEACPKFALAVYNRGLCFQAMKEYFNAIEDFSVCLTIDPTSSVDYWERRAQCYEALGMKQLVIDDYSKLLNQLVQGDSIEERESQKEKKYFNQLKEERNKVVCRTLTRRAHLYHELGRYKLAIKDYDQALCMDPHDHKLWFNKASDHLRLSEHYLALQSMNKAISHCTIETEKNVLDKYEKVRRTLIEMSDRGVADSPSSP